MAVTFDKRLGGILAKRKVLSQEKSDEVWADAQKQGKSYAEIAVQNKLVSEEVLLAALAAESNRPPVRLENITPDEQVVESFREEWALAYKVLPLSKISNILTIAVVNPFDVLKLDDLRLITSSVIRPVISLEWHIREAITRAYHADEKTMEDICS